jgi:glucose-6-phosphate 1-dehydrogenase
MTLRFNAKLPGPSLRMDGVAMKFNYRERFQAAPNTGYETLLYDCMIGDATGLRHIGSASPAAGSPAASAAATRKAFK